MTSGPSSPNRAVQLSVIDTLCIPFLIPAVAEVENCSTNASDFKSTECVTAESPKASVFAQELQKISLLKEIKPKNPIKELKPPTGGGHGRFAKARARSNSPTRDSLTILNRNYLFFGAFNPVVPAAEELPIDFTGLENPSAGNLEEDDDLQAIKRLYCQMVDNAEEDNGSSVCQSALPQ